MVKLLAPLVVILQLLPGSVEAQVCSGFRSLTLQPFQFVQTVTVNQDFLAIQATLRGGRHAYGELGVGTLLHASERSDFPNYREFTAALGYEKGSAQPGILIVCPVVMVSADATSGRYQPGGHHGYSLSAAVTAGVQIGLDPERYQVLSFEMRLEHARSSVLFPPDPI